MLVINTLRGCERHLVEVLRRYTATMTLARLDPDNPDVPEQFMNWWSTTALDFDEALGYAKATFNLEYKWPWS